MTKAKRKFKTFTLKCEVEVVQTRKFTDKVIAQAKKQGIRLPSWRGHMRMNVKGMKRITMDWLRTKTDSEDWGKILDEHVNFCIMERLGIETYPLEEEVTIADIKDVRKSDHITAK